jgi:hypothetical protein
MASAAASAGLLRERAARLLLKFWEGVAPHLGQGADGLGRVDPQRPQIVVEAMIQPYSPCGRRETTSFASPDPRVSVARRPGLSRPSELF